jgi:predicted Zn-dependent protease
MNGYSLACGRAALIAAAAALVSAGCATTGINKGQFNIISSDEEVQMGQQFTAEVEKEYTVYENPAVTAYVQGVGNKITAVCDRSDIQYRFAVIEKDEMNAFALPGGYIYVYTGLMKHVDDEAELAAVLAHEVGHVAARHSAERLSQMYGYQFIASLVLGENPNVYAELFSNIFSSTGFLYFGRQNEYEADRLGAKYLNAAGYDVGGMVDLMGKLKDLEGREPSKFEEWLSTHPPTSERLAQVQTYVTTLPKPASPVRNQAGYAKIKTQLP